MAHSPEAFSNLVDYINAHRAYNPRPQIVSRQLSREFVVDLLRFSRKFRNHSRRKLAVFRTDCTIEVNSAAATIDLALGLSDAPIKREATKNDVSAEIDGRTLTVYDMTPDRFTLFMENKSLVTAHRNIRNRTRILREYEEIMRLKEERAIRVGTMLLGTAIMYLNVDRVKWAQEALEALCARLKPLSVSLNNLYDLMGTGNPAIHNLLKNQDVAKLFCSYNREGEPERSLKIFVDEVPLKSDQSNVGYDFLIVQFIHVDNIDPAKLDEPAFFRSSKYEHMRYVKAIGEVAALYDARFS
ncbi:MAG: hypothetical protein DRO93_11910 [Candidatus Thorarchaeota archaeon]|nr:MAG: hypothetical protein DRO93_11910 [Candidatus Thorarchaeota archaeon]